MGFNKILIILLMISSVMLTGCTSINLKYFSAGTNSRGMLEGNFDLVEVDETTKIKDEVDETTTGEDSLIKNTNKGTSIDDDDDANNFYNQPTGNTSKTPINTNNNSSSTTTNNNNSSTTTTNNNNSSTTTTTNNNNSTTNNKNKSKHKNANVGDIDNGVVPQVK